MVKITRSRIVIVAHAAGVLTQAKRIWALHPLLKHISVAIVNYFSGLCLDGNAAPLVELAILDAVTRHDDTDPTSQSDACVDAYLIGLFRVISKAGLWTFTLLDKSIQWEFENESWVDFCKRGDVTAQLNPNPQGSPELYRLLCEQFGVSLCEPNNTKN